MSLSLVDQVVDRYLFMDWHETELRSDNSTRIGWAPIPEGFRDMEAKFSGPVLTTDCTAFDWTLPSWVVQELLEARLEMVSGGSPEYEIAVRRRYAEVLGPQCRLQLPDGSIWQQNRWGMMKSGWLRTLADNSACQLMIHALAYKRAFGADPGNIWAMGDDIIMDFPKNLEPLNLSDELSRLGLLVKRWSRDREFAGFLFLGGGVVEPLYPDKHIHILNRVSDEMLQEIIDAYGLLYSLAPPSEVREFLDTHTTLSRSLRRAWALGLIKLTIMDVDRIASWL